MRYLQKHILRDLERKKMVWVGGPRQVGKTTLAESILQQYTQDGRAGRYFNWDFMHDRRDVLAYKWHADDLLLVFDEIHKYPRWKNYLKGVYDKFKAQHQFLVAGSARLNVFKQGGDSLLGRYHYWRLHPFSLFEHPPSMSQQECFSRLLRVGGFPEPFLDGDETEAKRWRRDRFDLILRDDIRDLGMVRDIQNLELFVDALRHRVGSPIVLANIADDLQVSQPTLKKWLVALERMYVVFVVTPYSKNLPRALQKPPKVYFYDNADVIGDEGARFENLVATHLLKRLQYREDAQGDRYHLHYIRDKEKREVDFAITRDGVLDALIEAKWADDNISKHLRYYADRLQPAQCQQIVGQLRRPYTSGALQVVSPFEAFAQL